VGLLVRRAVPDDSDGIAEVLRAAFAGHRASYTPAAYSATTPDATAVRRRFAEGPRWVALVDGAVAGTVSAVPKGDALHVRSMAVLPAARGHGAGRALLAAVEECARSGGFPSLTLSTTPFLSAAIRLYEGAGFVRTADGPRELAGTPLFTMAKPLDGSRRP
jgi:GNAT superfamily N-acetyltransferase